MSVIKNIVQKLKRNSIDEELIYELIAEELEKNIIYKGLMTKED